MSTPSLGAAGGVFEVGIGTADPVAAIAYWQNFGYRVGPAGTLDAAAARALYGVDSGLRSIRLLHGSADHGLIRLMVWEKPRGPGLALEPFRRQGSLWTGQKTLAMATLQDHAEIRAARGGAITIIPPFYTPVVPPAQVEPFASRIPGIREMTVVQPETRQVFLEFTDYDLPLYGIVDPHSLFRTSNFTHVCLLLQGDSAVALDFYDRVLGLRRNSTVASSFERATGARRIFDLSAGEAYHVVDFDDPRVPDNAAPGQRRSGRLKTIRLEGKHPVPDRRDRTGPGMLGLSLFTLRVTQIDAMQAAVRGSGATEVSAVATDEFGRRAFTARAPDGTHWTLLEV